MLQLRPIDCVIPFCLSRRFECKSDGQYFVVQHVALEPTSGDVEESAYTGPVRLAEEGQGLRIASTPNWLLYTLAAGGRPSNISTSIVSAANASGPIASRCTRSWTRSCRSTLRNIWLRWVDCVSRHAGRGGQAGKRSEGGFDAQLSPAVISGSCLRLRQPCYFGMFTSCLAARLPACSAAWMLSWAPTCCHSSMIRSSGEEG